jgi:multidrug efflux system membrane fusion protein
LTALDAEKNQQDAITQWCGYSKKGVLKMPEYMPDTGSPDKPQHSLSDLHSRRHWWIRLLIIIVVLFGAGGFFFFQHQATGRSTKAKSAPPQSAVPVVTATIRKGNIGVYINALGTVTPVYTVTVTSRVQGEIMSVNYREGQMVHKGDLLLVIDPRPYQAQLTQAEGQLAHDQAVLKEAQIDLDRYKAAYSRNAIPKQQLDPGNIVQANSTTALVVITQLQPITVIFSVAEDYLPQIQHQIDQGRRLIVEAFDRTQQKKIATGELLTLDNQIDPTTGTVKLKAIFSNEDNSLFPNQFVNVRLLVETQQGATLVPTAAIQRNAQGAFVYVVKPDQTVAMRTVSVGTTDGNIAGVEGLEPGDVIVVDGFDKLQDGVKVIARTGLGETNRGGNL